MATSVTVNVNVNDLGALAYLTNLDQFIDRINNKKLTIGGQGGGAITRATSQLTLLSKAFAGAFVIKNVKEALSTMKEVDTQLTNIRKVTNESAEVLKKLGDSAYSTASKYGVSAEKYLEAAYDFAKAGKSNYAGLAELNTKAMLVGDTTAAVASKFLLSADAAYKYQGSIEKLSLVIDKADFINNNYATSFDKIAAGMPIVASTASMANMSIDELMSALGTITSVTQETGTKAATALRALILNITGEVGAVLQDEAGQFEVTADSVNSMSDALKKYGSQAIKAAKATGDLVDPIEAIRSLSKAYKNGDLSRNELFDILTNVGGKLRTNQLAALVENFELFEKMLGELKGAAGTADKEIEQMLDSWNAKTNILKNTWTEFISDLVSTSAIKGGLDTLTEFVRVLDSLALSLEATGKGLEFLFNSTVAKLIPDSVKGAFGELGDQIGSFTSPETKQSLKAAIEFFDLLKEGKSIQEAGRIATQHYEEALSALEKASNDVNNAQEDVESTVEGVTEEFEDVTSAINDAASALDNYAKATEKTKSAYSDSYRSAYQEFLEDYKAGKTDSNVVRAAADLFLPPEIQEKLGYDLQAMGELLASDLYQGIYNGASGNAGVDFVNYMAKNMTDALDEIVNITTKDGAYKFEYASAEKLAEYFNLPIGAIQALIGALDEFGVQAGIGWEDAAKYADALGLIGENAGESQLSLQDVADSIVAMGKTDPVEIRKIFDALQEGGFLEGLIGELSPEAIGSAISQAIKEATEEVQTDEEIEPPKIDVDTEDAQGKVDTLKEEVQGISDPPVIIQFDIDPATADTATLQEKIDGIDGVIDTKISPDGILTVATQASAISEIIKNVGSDGIPIGIHLTESFEGDLADVTQQIIDAGAEGIPISITPGPSFKSSLITLQEQIENAGGQGIKITLDLSQYDGDKAKLATDIANIPGVITVTLNDDNLDVETDAANAISAIAKLKEAANIPVTYTFEPDMEKIQADAEAAAKQVKTTYQKAFEEETSEGNFWDWMTLGWGKGKKGESPEREPLTVELPSEIEFEKPTTLTEEDIANSLTQAFWNGKNGLPTLKVDEPIEADIPVTPNIEFEFNDNLIHDSEIFSQINEFLSEQEEDTQLQVKIGNVSETEDDIDGIIESLEDVPGITDVKFEDNAIVCEGNVDSLRSAIEALPSSKTITISIVTNGSLPDITPHASGTKNAPGGLSLVNERGPELISDNGKAYIANGGKPAIVNLGQGAIVLTAEETRQALGSFSLNKGIDAYALGSAMRIADIYSGGRSFSGNPATGSEGIPINGGGSGGDGGSSSEKEEKPKKSKWDDKEDKLKEELDALDELAEWYHNQKKHKEEGDTYAEAIKKIDELRREYLEAGFDETSKEVTTLANKIYDYEKEIAEAKAHAIDDLEDELDNLESQIELAENQGDLNRMLELQNEAQKKVAQLIEAYRAAGFSDTSPEILKLANMGFDYASDSNSTMKDLWKNLIDAIEDMRDTQDDANELAEKQLAVDEAREALTNAQNQRTVRIFNPVTGQWEWVADAKSVKQAQENLTNAEQALLKEQQSQELNALKKAMENGGSLSDVSIGPGLSALLSGASLQQTDAFASALGLLSGGFASTADTSSKSIFDSVDSHDNVTQYTFNGVTIDAATAESTTLAQLTQMITPLALTNNMPA